MKRDVVLKELNHYLLNDISEIVSTYLWNPTLDLSILSETVDRVDLTRSKCALTSTFFSDLMADYLGGDTPHYYFIAMVTNKCSQTFVDAASLLTYLLQGKTTHPINTQEVQRIDFFVNKNEPVFSYVGSITGVPIDEDKKLKKLDQSYINIHQLISVYGFINSEEVQVWRTKYIELDCNGLNVIDRIYLLKIYLSYANNPEFSDQAYIKNFWQQVDCHLISNADKRVELLNGWFVEVEAVFSSDISLLNRMANTLRKWKGEKPCCYEQIDGWCYSKASDLYKKVLFLDAHNRDALYGLALIHFIRYKKQEALQLLSIAIQINDNDSKSHCLLGEIYLDNHELENACIHLKKALLISGDVNAHRLISTCYYRKRDYKNAILHLEKSVDLSRPKDRSDLEELALYYEAQGDNSKCGTLAFTRAQSYLRRADRFDDSRIKAWIGSIEEKIKERREKNLSNEDGAEEKVGMKDSDSSNFYKLMKRNERSDKRKKRMEERARVKHQQEDDDVLKDIDEALKDLKEKARVISYSQTMFCQKKDVAPVTVEVETKHLDDSKGHCCIIL